VGSLRASGLPASSESPGFKVCRAGKRCFGVFLEAPTAKRQGRRNGGRRRWRKLWQSQGYVCGIGKRKSKIRELNVKVQLAVTFISNIRVSEFQCPNKHIRMDHWPGGTLKF